MSYSRVGVVTGANQGIGFAIVRQLALQYPTSIMNNGPLLIYLTARDKSNGETALKALQNDAQLKEAKALTTDGGLSEIQFHVLDITDSESRTLFADHLRKTHADGVDFCINNAGIALNGFDIDVVKKTLDCNYYSTPAMCHAILPSLKSDGRLVNVASTSGTLDKYSPHIRERFQSSRTEADITSIMQDFQSAVETNQEKDAGFPSAAYAVSKAGLIGGTRVFAKNIREEQTGVLVNCCCPGFVNTRMTKGNGEKTPDAGAQTPVTLALGDIAGRSGLFWKDDKVVSW